MVKVSATADGDNTPIDKINIELVLSRLQVDPQKGLSEAEAAQRLLEFGENVPGHPKSLQAKVLRDGEFKSLAAKFLVPGDIIRIRLGDVIPADVKLLHGDPIKINQAALIGESMPVTKSAGDEAFSGCIVTQGEIQAVVHATGVNTFFGKVAAMMR